MTFKFTILVDVLCFQGPGIDPLADDSVTWA